VFPLSYGPICEVLCFHSPVACEKTCVRIRPVVMSLDTAKVSNSLSAIITALSPPPLPPTTSAAPSRQEIIPALVPVLASTCTK
jgi:hypothetical protein